MARSVCLVLAAYALGYFALVQTQDSTATTAPTSMYTMPTTADDGRPVIPNIADPQAVDAQTVCPGYKATNVHETKEGVTADLKLSGKACNVYGNDVEELSLQVEYQALDRLNVRIQPKYIGQDNYTWFVLPEGILTQPGIDTPGSGPNSDLDFSWSNDPTFTFKVARRSTGDVLFSTEGTKLVYEDQFVEFKTSLPENYNLYGLGEVIHGFRLGNNLTREHLFDIGWRKMLTRSAGTLYNADVGDNIDANIYGHQPIYYDTRYFEVDDAGSLNYAADASDKSANYKSFTHGVFQRNAHAQEILLREPGITWRALGGSIGGVENHHS
jgi:alpha-glucosidase